MKVISLMLLMALGLLSVQSSNVEETFALVDDLPLLEDYEDIFDGDDEADEVENEDRNKRFFVEDFKKLKNEIENTLKTVEKFFTKTFEDAKREVEKISKKINFEKGIKELIPHIHSGMSVKACQTVCATFAKVILGPLSFLVHKVSEPLCNAALAELEKLAENA